MYDPYANMHYSKMTKEEILERWPFYTPWNIWEEEEKDEEIDNNYTLIEDIPCGWWMSFGEKMSDELKAALGEYVNDFKFLQIKEKYGSLRMYGYAAPYEALRVLDEYEYLSERTCFFCGKPAEWHSNGYILPYCDDCKKSTEEKTPISFSPLEED